MTPLMTTPVPVPLWLLLLLCLVAVWALVSRLLVPSVRWFLRRRVHRVLDEVNTRLQIRIQPFKMTKRQVLIDRLLYDPKVLEAAEGLIEAEGMPRAVAMDRVRRYAQEIVPAFNPLFYFRLSYSLGRAIARSLYRVRLGYADEASLRAIPPDSTIVLLMNHRSNMDYVLISYMVADRSALSYAVGEWARIWPLESLIRAMGAYFVRRRSRNPLYRRVLQRYVQMATAAGVTQAVYPEGGLSRDGRLRPPKLGLLDYMLRDFDPQGERDLVFVPVGINYDRTLEDRTLLRDTEPSAAPRRGFAAAATTAGFFGRNLWMWLQGKWFRFGYACVSFGRPLSMRQYLQEHNFEFRKLEREARFGRIETLAGELMERIGSILPVLPVPLVATVFVEEPERRWGELELQARVQELLAALEASGAQLYIPRQDRAYAVAFGLRNLVLRHLVEETDGLYRAAPGELPVLRYYANSIAHLG